MDGEPAGSPSSYVLPLGLRALVQRDIRGTKFLADLIDGLFFVV
jgi:hypothetical protein